ncbi:MAG: 3-phosphoshikimate 1-carboxyvinyltransferase [Candidatus Omnitrophica bacterium CG11_big_fil_rev_8_21_14_0_20_64_10]|nr:MAG: 3-phosphoshikimate 1-carboxyvinyltransferase [Candidatus Omnitrophica bacterium CG11_big_fil_rev_8_21_14_0_20_64_10]
MSILTVHPVDRLTGTITVPGDKSVSHRGVLIGAAAHGTTRITGCLMAQDVLSSIGAVRALGVPVEVAGTTVIVNGRGIESWKEPKQPLDLGNSGTTTRLLMGLLSGSGVSAELTGDDSLRSRPMGRVVEPLTRMGAKITGGERLPLRISGRQLKGIRYELPVSSAQVKSALLLAGLGAQGVTTVVEPVPTRDHTERMLKAFGAELTVSGREILLTPGRKLIGRPVSVPGDISSAAFFVAGALLVKGSDLTIRNVGLNPGRTGLLTVLKAMGGAIEVQPEAEQGGEPVGTVRIRGSALRGTRVTAEAIPSLIDELPVLMAAATQAEGVTLLEGVGELRVKETDRVHSMVTGLTGMGAKVRADGENLIIEGSTPLTGAAVDSFGDHRTVMALAIAGLIATGPTRIHGAEAVAISFPQFPDLLKRVSGTER